MSKTERVAPEEAPNRTEDSERNQDQWKDP